MVWRLGLGLGRVYDDTRVEESLLLVGRLALQLPSSSILLETSFWPWGSFSGFPLAVHFAAFCSLRFSRDSFWDWVGFLIWRWRLALLLCFLESSFMGLSGSPIDWCMLVDL